jgi:hypothetical protein
MTAQEGVERLKHVLTKDDADRYRFCCRKAFLMVRLLGLASPLRFSARDEVGFRIDERDLSVEEIKTGAIRKQFPWEQVECLAVGEPETDNGTLFQG